MAPPKAKARGNQQQAQPLPLPSDYETDAPPAVELPRPPPRSNEQLNLSVLRRHYPEVTALVHQTPYAVLYAFSPDSQLWEKVGIEGTLFICELTPSPTGVLRYSAIILNRRGLNNFKIDLTSHEEVEITEEYVIMQNDQIYGIWVFSEPPPSSTANARSETAAVILALAKKALESKEASEQEARDDEQVSEQVEESVPMGRQLSLRELFGQQREQDAGFSVHHHQRHPQQSQQPQQHQESWAPPQPAQVDVLGQLFMKAKQDYNGVG